MSKTTMNVAKAVGLGLAATTAAVAIGTTVSNKKKGNPMKSMKKSAGKAVHTMSGILGNVENMLK